MLSQNKTEGENNIQKMKEKYCHLLQHFFSLPVQNENVKLLSKKFQEDQHVLDKPSILRTFIRQLYSIDENYITVIPILFLKYFQKELQKQKTLTEIDKFFLGKIECFGDKFVRKQVKEIKDQDSISLDLSKVKDKFTKKFNLFNQNAYFQSIDKLLIQIKKVSEQSKKHFVCFQSFTNKICMSYGGIYFKANTKFPNNMNQTKEFRNYMRVVEKMFEKKISSNQKQNFLEDLQNSLREKKLFQISQIGKFIINSWIQYIQKLLKKNIIQKVPTQCFISDFIRGCCFFENKKAIIKAAQQILNQCERNGYEVIDVNQRIGRGTHQILFKIRFQKIVGQFQLIRIRQKIEIDVENRQYIHNLYQIRRSPLGPIFGSYLFLTKFDNIMFYKMELSEVQKKLKTSEAKNQEEIKLKQNCLI